jgi:dihydrofolate reductase
LATGKVVLDVSMSLDGFTAGPNVREAEPMGDGSERLHAWMAGKGPDGEFDIGVRREVDATVGAAVIGRRTYDLGLDSWGGTPWPGVPSFVVTNRAKQDLLGDNGVLDAVVNCSRCVSVPAAAAAPY